MSLRKPETKQSILDQVMDDPKQLQENPELLKMAMKEFASSIEIKLKEIERRWNKPMIH